GVSTCGFVTVFYTTLADNDPVRSRGWSFYHQQSRDGHMLFTTGWSRHAVVRLPGLELRRAATFVELAITWPLVMLIALMLPASRLVGRAVRHARRRLRRRSGRCLGCGYDIRATPRRCPEC